MEKIKKKRIREKPGQVFRVPLGNGLFGYGQLADPDSIFFDYTDDGKNTDPAHVIQQPVVFEVTVDSYAIKDQIWEVIAVLPVNPYFMRNKRAFQYMSGTNEYYIWEKGKEPRPGIPEDIKGHEMITSWGHRHVEQRLLDYFEGRPNYTYEYQHNLHNPDFPKGRIAFYQQYNYTVKEDRPDYKPEDDS
jgi:hypothetical protein